MALKKTAIAKLAALAKMDEKVLSDAIAAPDEQDVAIPEDLQVLTKTEQETRDRNKYNEGKTAGSEMVIKDIKTTHKLSIDSNDPEKVVEAIGKKAVEEAKIAPDEQVKEQKKLVDQWKQKATTAEQKATELEGKITGLSVDNKLRGLLPKDRSDILTDDEYLVSIKSKFRLETKDGREVVIDNATGEVVRDKIKLEPILPGDAISGYFTERKGWLVDPKAGGGQGGRGGGNSNPGAMPKFTKRSEVIAHIESQGISIQGSEGQAMVRAAMKENPDIDFNS
jgi:hypothetical protein